MGANQSVNLCMKFVQMNLGRTRLANVPAGATVDIASINGGQAVKEAAGGARATLWCQGLMEVCCGLLAATHAKP